jgi:hypothetical protein
MLIIVLFYSFISQGYSKDQIISKYSSIIIKTIILIIITTPDICSNCIFNNFSINMHIDVSWHNIPFQEMMRWSHLNTLGGDWKQKPLAPIHNKSWIKKVVMQVWIQIQNNRYHFSLDSEEIQCITNTSLTYIFRGDCSLTLFKT